MEVNRIADAQKQFISFFEPQKEYALFAVGSGACSLIKQASTHETLKRSANFYLCDNLPMGCGNDALQGRHYAEECVAKLDSSLIKNIKKAVVVATLGGGTGTGGAPVFAQHLSEKGIEVVNIVTLPFRFEGRQRWQKSQYAVCEMSRYSALTVIINDDMYVKQFKDKTLNEFYDNLGHFITETILLELNLASTAISLKNNVPWYKRFFGRIVL